MVIWIYSLVALWCKGVTRMRCAVSALALFMLYMIRPSFLYLVPVSLVYLVLFIRIKKGKEIKAVCLAVFVPMLLLGGYVGMYKHYYGIYNVTCVHLINQYEMLSHNKDFDLSTVEDPQMRSALEVYLNSQKGMVISFYELAGGDFSKTEDLLRDINGNDPSRLIKIVGRNFYKMSIAYDSTGYMINPPFFYLTGLLALDGKMYLLSLLIITIWIATDVVKRRNVALQVTLYLVVLGCIATSIVGAGAEYTRLSAPSVPVIFLLLGMIMSRLCRCQEAVISQ